MVVLSLTATLGLAIMWISFWRTVRKQGTDLIEVIQSEGFFKTTAVMGIIAALMVLTLTNNMDGEIAGSILSAIAGYILGRSDRKPTNGTSKPCE